MVSSSAFLLHWVCLYAVILAAEAISDYLDRAQFEDILKSLAGDDDAFVQAKLASLQLS